MNIPIILVGLIITLVGCAGSPYGGYYYAEPYPEDYYDQFYEMPYSYPYPQYYYYSGPSISPPGYFEPGPEEHFEGGFRGEGEHEEHEGGFEDGREPGGRFRGGERR